MSAPDGQREQQLVRGQIVGVVAKGPDRWQVSVQQQNEQRPRNLWTKDQAIVSSLMQVIGQGFDFLCNVSHWTNQSNQPVRSLWLETVGPYGTIPMPLQAQQMGREAGRGDRLFLVGRAGGGDWRAHGLLCSSVEVVGP